MISVSVIIVNFNARYFLKNCIESLLESDIKNQVEIIVVDNNSTDGSCDMLREEFQGVSWIENKENIGFSKANNLGVKIAKGKYVLILNPDTILKSNTISEFYSFAEKQEDFGAGGPQFIDGSGKYLPESKRNFPTLKVAGTKLLGYSKLYYSNHIERDEIAEIDILTGAFMFIKKSVYDEVGGFDEDFFMYGDDIDLSYRILKSGYRNFYLGNTRVLHFKGESTVKDQMYLKNFYGALSIFYRKHFPEKKWLYKPIDLFIKGIISVNSIGVPKKTKQTSEIKSFVLIGKDKDCYARLVDTIKPLKSAFIKDIDFQPHDYDFVFFDSKSLGYSEVIEHIGNPEFSVIKKRFLSKDRSYYLGSDYSDRRGEVVQL
ncbi:glycosyltransferase family 2 protein [Lutimonas saemankumensis]|uniref:glycosyltransferase family 2 protein n=1 Tax=Lutimonas saemankumensis TaxID=483016 RepID=UPI001CD567D0|nr:glycosyltransferase family 2 protein [Lutimonas saemankumensis]MCA0933773.1 glycosyltransferase family 2 protein [Lutimonas saemankumensis]